MRPATAVSKKSKLTSGSIWKKYETIKPQQNTFYCFKTISQILEGNQRKPLTDDKKQYYHHRVNSPRSQITQGPLQKQNTYKRISHIIERNPNTKKALTNNFFSTKEIGKQNTDYTNFFKITTQNQIKNTEKFLPYRQQSISIIKHSKILSETETQGKEEVPDIKIDTKNKDKTYKKKTMLKKRQKTCQVDASSMTQKQMQSKSFKNKNEFLIQQWDNFDQSSQNLSILLCNATRLS